MAKHVDSHSEMAQARHTDGLNVIFDQKSPGSSRVSSSASSCTTDSNRRGRYRSSSSSSTSTSSGSSATSRSRSRSYPRCHRRFSRCRCDDHGSRRHHRARSRSYSRSPPRHYRARSRSYSRSPTRHYRARSRSYSRSPPRHYRARSRSYSRSPPRHYRARSRSYGRTLPCRYRAYSRSCSHTPSPDRYSRHCRYYRSRSRSPRHWGGRRRPASMLRCRFSRSPSRTYRGRSRSRSTGRSVRLSLHDKRKLLEAAKANALKMLGVEKIDLPESVNPILSKKPEAKTSSPEPVLRAEESFQKMTEDTEPEPGMSSPKMKIAFSENNFVAKPTVVAPSAAKVTPRVDSIESRKPYGHWIPIGSG